MVGGSFRRGRRPSPLQPRVSREAHSTPTQRQHLLGRPVPRTVPSLPKKLLQGNRAESRFFQMFFRPTLSCAGGRPLTMSASGIKERSQPRFHAGHRFDRSSDRWIGDVGAQESEWIPRLRPPQFRIACASSSACRGRHPKPGPRSPGTTVGPPTASIRRPPNSNPLPVERRLTDNGVSNTGVGKR